MGALYTMLIVGILLLVVLATLILAMVFTSKSEKNRERRVREDMRQIKSQIEDPDSED